MLLVGMAASAVAFGFLLEDFTPKKLIEVIQGAAVAPMALNVVALWKQEARDPARTAPDAPRAAFGEAWGQFIAEPRTKRLLAAVGLGAAAFSMQDVLLEPYGGDVLALSVSQTTYLTAIFAVGTIIGFAIAARRLTRRAEPHRLAAIGALVGVFAFAFVVLADPLNSPLLFRFGVGLIGVGGGLFSVCTLTALMALAREGQSGVAIGAWGAVQATCAGLAIATGGAVRDIVQALAADGMLGPAFSGPAAGYGVVYHMEIMLLFLTLAAIGPLARYTNAPDEPATNRKDEKFGLAAFPG